MCRLSTLVSLFSVVALQSAAVAEEYSLDLITLDHRGFGQFQLLSNSIIQEALKLSDEQKSKVKEKSKELGRIYEQTPKANPTGKSPEETAKIRRANFGPASDAGDKFAKEILNPQQFDRLHEIFYQAVGFRVFTDVDRWFPSLDGFRQALKLSDSQLGELRTISRNFERGQSQINRDQQLDRKGKNQKIVALCKANLEKCIELLSPAQKETFKALVGKEFDTDKLLKK
jgi:hypothetical protein